MNSNDELPVPPRKKGSEATHRLVCIRLWVVVTIVRHGVAVTQEMV